MNSAAIRRGLIEAAEGQPGWPRVQSNSAAIRRGLIEAVDDLLDYLRLCPNSAAIRRGLIEAASAIAAACTATTRIPRLFAAASLKQDGVD